MLKITCKNGDVLEGTHEELVEYQELKMRQQQPNIHTYHITLPDTKMDDVEVAKRMIAQLIAKGAIDKMYM